jgi:Flp pilus assembly protein TadG
MVEAALMMPWLVFLFVGVFDFGFYCYAAICTQSAARAAAVATSQSGSSQTTTIECSAALGELNSLPNMWNPPVTTCAASASLITNALPVAVAIATLTCTPNANSFPAGLKCADCTTNNCNPANDPIAPTSVQTAVTYQTLPMIPIPGILTGRVQLTRVSEMRIWQ